MRQPLVTPSIVVFRLKGAPKSKAPRFWDSKPHPVNYHFGPTSAIADARRLAREGVPVWIEENGKRATLLEPSRSPATRERLRARA